MFHRKLSIGVMVMVLAFSIGACFKKAPGKGPVTLNVYGLENSDVFDPIISRYREQYGNVTVRYKKFNDPDEFENLLVNEIAQGEGPDVFFVHNTWLPRHSKKLVPLISKDFTPVQFGETFVKVASDDFIQPDPADGVKKIYALPLYVDTLALYYNKKDFEQKVPERGKPAPTWDGIAAEAARFRDQSTEGILHHGEIALGRGDNIKLAIDILYTLFLQNGVSLYDTDFKQLRLGSEAQKAFDLFLSFAAGANKEYSWSTDLVAADEERAEVQAFLAGRVSAILGYSDLYPRLETELKNVKSQGVPVIDLKDVGVMPVPQFSDDQSEYKVFADYYGLGVSRNSKNPDVAWNFVQFAASQKNERAYHQKTKRPAARRDLIEEQKKEPITDVFVGQVGYAGSYRIFSDQKFAEFLREAVNNVNLGQTLRQALSEAEGKMNEVIKSEAPEGLYPKPKKKK